MDEGGCGIGHLLMAVIHCRMLQDKTCGVSSTQKEGEGRGGGEEEEKEEEEEEEEERT